MALPAPVATQIAALNAAVNKLLNDRDRINSLFDDGLGASSYSLFTPANQQVAKTAITNDMSAASNSIASVVSALQAM